VLVSHSVYNYFLPVSRFIFCLPFHSACILVFPPAHYSFLHVFSFSILPIIPLCLYSRIPFCLPFLSA
jgi:hypothetical protein